MGEAIQMSAVLQVALLLASVAIVVFVAFCLPAVLQLRKHAARITQTLEELKAEVSVLVKDSRTVLRSVSELSTRAHQQCDNVEQVIHSVRSWTERVDRVVEEVGSVLEPPILTAARNAQIFRKGVAKFFESFLKRNHHQPQKSEE
jgi:uncharacterized protein YoxC